MSGDGGDGETLTPALSREGEGGGGRVRLPGRRPGLTFDFVHVNPAGVAMLFTASCGFYDVSAEGVFGRLGEVFLSHAKTDSQADIEAHDAALLLSLALQHGVTLAEISHTLLRGQDGRPHGVMGALVDEVKRRAWV